MSRPRVDITGQRFGRLVALSYTGQYGSMGALWLCRCDCGNEKVIPVSKLRSGLYRSCGCKRREVLEAQHHNNSAKKRFQRTTVSIGVYNRYPEMNLDPEQMLYLQNLLVEKPLHQKINPALAAGFEVSRRVHYFLSNDSLMEGE